MSTIEPRDNKHLRSNNEEHVGCSRLHALSPEQGTIKNDGSCPHDTRFTSSPISLTSFNSFASNGDNSTSSDESSDEEIEPFWFEDKDEIWDPPDAENDQDNNESSIASLDDSDNECADGDRKVSAKLSSHDCFQEGISSSYHFKEEEVEKGKLKNSVSELLKNHGVDTSDKKDESWVEIVTRLAWQAVSLFVDPDTSEGNVMDIPAAYLKIKCIASGSRSESKLINGLVFTKHAAHKSMVTKHENPTLLLIQGTLSPSPSSYGLPSFNSMLSSSFDLKISENEENITGLVENLEASHPNVILVERCASRDVLNAILKLGVTVVLDMKQSRLHRVARSTGSPVIWSDGITLNQELKHCDSLYFEKFVEEHAVGKDGKKPCKTLMFLEGCPHLGGCTVLLKGSQSEELKKIKNVLQRAVEMAYHLVLENSFFVGQKAMFSTIIQATDFSDEDSASLFFETSDSPCGERHNIHGASTDGVQVPVTTSCDDGSPHVQESTSGTASIKDKALHSHFQPLSEIPSEARNAEKVDEGEERIWPKGKNSSILDSESILVLMTSRNALRRIICVPNHLLRIEFYRSFDVPLARFFRDNLFDQSHHCAACGGLPEAHNYYYAHRKKHLMIRVKRLDDEKALPRESEGRLWMWSRCGKCEPDKEKATKRVSLSSAAHHLSFGKFLELNFRGHSSFNRLSSCGHSFQKDFLYFFGFGSMVAAFQYSCVAIYRVSVPSSKLEFNSSINRVWLQQEIESVYNEGLLLFTEVANYLEKIESWFSGSHLVLNGSSKALGDITDMLKLERSEFEENIKKMNESSQYSAYKVLSLNRLRWEISLEARVWDCRLKLLISSSLTLVWNPFAQIREECKKDLHKGYLPKFGHVPNFELLHSRDKFLPTVSQLIINESSRLHVPVSNGDYIVSEYDGEISSSVACAIALMKDLYSPTSDTDKNTTLKCTSSEPSLFSCLDGLNLLDPSVSNGQPHPEVTLGIEKYPIKGKYSVVIMYASEFHFLRNICCPSELDYIDSLNRCKLWDAKGGKNKSVFTKTLDDRLIIKELNKMELESFMKFAPDYFHHMKQSFDSGNETCLAKILGVYQVTIRRDKSGNETKHQIMVQENLCYDRNVTRLYNLKIPLHARFTATADGVADVLLDQNFANENSFPLYISQEANRLLQRAVWNDTIFLSSCNVLDYSLLVGVDEQRRELVCGIIGYLSHYSWGKQLVTWGKTSLAVPRNFMPTVISPREYKQRFRKFISKHFLAWPMENSNN